MKITENLIPEVWTRRVRPLNGLFSLGVHRAPHPIGINSYGVDMTQSDFMNEYYPSAHKIYSHEFLSMRPIWESTGKKDEKGEEIFEFVGYDDIERVSIGWQWAIAMKKVTHFASAGLTMYNETVSNIDYSVQFSNIKSWYDLASINMGRQEWIKSCFTTGNGALYIGIDKRNRIYYKVFSYLNGDELFTAIDDDGNEVLYRKYILKGKTAIDIISVKSYQTWVPISDESESDQKWLMRFKKFINSIGNNIPKNSEDGYKCIKNEPAPLAKFNMPQFVYVKLDDVVWGVVQQTIDSLEKAISYVSEEVKSSAFPILFVASQGIKSLPPSELNSKIIGVTGDAETVKNSKAEFLTPPNASNIATIDIDNKVTDIKRTTATVDIPPEMLKSSEFSGAAIDALYTPEIQWCNDMKPNFIQADTDIAEILKMLVGVVEGKPSEYIPIHISVDQNIWTPRNEKEWQTLIIEKYRAGAISQKGMVEMLGDNINGDLDQILKEREDKMELENKYKSQLTKSQPATPVNKEDENREVIEEEGT